jgi:uncharacterized RDD family membrane protein YckC
MPTYDLRPADYGKRAVAYIIDVLYVWVPAFAGVIVAVVLVFPSQTRAIGVLLIVVSGAWFLFAGIWNDVVRQGTTGSTWGKARQSLALVDATTGETVGIGKALVRILAFWFFNSVTAGLFLIADLLMPAFSKRNQRIVDMLLKTLVVDTDPVSTTPDLLRAEPPAIPAPIGEIDDDPLA